MNDKKKNNTLALGLMLGFVIPVITFLLGSLIISQFALKNQVHYSEFISTYLYEAGLLIRFVSICVLPNLIPFFISLNKHKYYTARGVLSSTVVYVILIAFLTFGMK
jgi:ethanolamine transporter EutH